MLFVRMQNYITFICGCEEFFSVLIDHNTLDALHILHAFKNDRRIFDIGICPFIFSCDGQINGITCHGKDSLLAMYLAGIGDGSVRFVFDQNGINIIESPSVKRRNIDDTEAYHHDKQ